MRHLRFVRVREPNRPAIIARSNFRSCLYVERLSARSTASPEIVERRI